MTDNNSSCYRIKPDKNWKVAVFDGINSRQIEGKTYSVNDFISSEDFIVHEVISLFNLKIGAFHVWYEKKKSFPHFKV